MQKEEEKKKELGIFFGPKNDAETDSLVLKQIYQVRGDDLR